MTSISPRLAARLAGILFLAAFAAYGAGNAIVDALVGGEDALAQVAAHPARLRLGATLMLLNSAIVVGIGVLLAPIVRERSATVAAGYLATRVVEGILLAAGVVLLLTLPPASELAVSDDAASIARTLAVDGNAAAYHVAIAGLGLGSLPFCWLLLRGRMTPPWLAWWGLGGYAFLLAGAVLGLYGASEAMTLAMAVPGGLFEVVFGVWLITRGLAAPGIDNIGQP